LIAKARHFSVTRADQISCPLRSPSFFDLQGRVLRIAFQQGKLLVSPCAGTGGQGAIIGSRNPGSRGGSLRWPLEGLCVSGLVVGQGATDAVVDAPGVKIGLELRVNRLRMVLVKPYV
jgi:hypothetical protein